MDVLPQDRVKSRSRETSALKFARHIGNNAAEMPVNIRIDTIIMTSNLLPFGE